MCRCHLFWYCELEVLHMSSNEKYFLIFKLTKNMCHYWNDFTNSCVMNSNEYESKSDRPLLIANCFTIELFTMCPVLVRGTHFHKDCHRRGVLFFVRSTHIKETLQVSRMRQIMAIFYLKLIIIVSCFEDMLGSHRAVVRSSFFQNKIR